MGLNWAEHTVEIDAPIETCFDAIVDYESFPAWQGAVDDTQVLERDGINGADGHYLFEDLGDGRTRATYKLGLEVGIPMPGMVARRVHKQTLKASVVDLKREAERRHAGEPRAAAGAAAGAMSEPSVERPSTPVAAR